jgi:hypothetical protein
MQEKSFAPARDRTPIARLSSPWSDTTLTELTRLMHVCYMTIITMHLNRWLFGERALFLSRRTGIIPHLSFIDVSVFYQFLSFLLPFLSFLCNLFTYLHFVTVFVNFFLPVKVVALMFLSHAMLSVKTKLYRAVCQ